MNNAYALEGLGCNCYAGLGSLGITRDQVVAFFIGQNKYVRNTKPTPLYNKPGEAPVATVAPNDNMGMVVHINEKGNWGRLDSGYWIFLADSMYTVLLSVPPPTGIVDAVGREIKNVAEFSWQNILGPVLVPAMLIVGGIYVVTQLGKEAIRTKLT